MTTITLTPLPTMDALQVEGTAGCGQTFLVGLVLEPESANPLLELYKPFGVAGVQKVLDALTKWKEKQE